PPLAGARTRRVDDDVEVLGDAAFDVLSMSAIGAGHRYLLADPGFLVGLVRGFQLDGGDGRLFRRGTGCGGRGRGTGTGVTGGSSVATTGGKCECHRDGRGQGGCA